MAQPLAFIDLEINKDGHIADIGCLKADGQQYSGTSVRELYHFLEGINFLCGHNILQHDIKYLEFDKEPKIVDTLYLSPLLFPAKPYHSLVKDYKLDPENSNNPLTDALKTKQLLEDEWQAFQGLHLSLREIFYLLLHDQKEFSCFFELYGYKPINNNLKDLVSSFFQDRICANALLDDLIYTKPIEMAYALALINVNDRISVLPPWVIKTFPGVQFCFQVLRNKPCPHLCNYCSSKLDPTKALQQWFGFSEFRQFDGIPLQENAVKAAIENKSLLAIFPTGGGKSLTFQLPALIAGEAERGLTVVISPLQSLMKDQVDNLEKRGITHAVTINGLLDPIERAKSIERVQDGGANLLYISPESLRSNTIQGLLEGRHITRFVIDEAHCFSTWGQDFRVDYLYIGEFIKKLQQIKNLDYSIPVSCFTATARQKVIEDIQKYFKEKLNIHLELFTTKATRSNLRYKVLSVDGGDKYMLLRSLLEESNAPAIIYVSRTKKAEDLAQKLNSDGFRARFYHGKMDTGERVENQNAFMNGDTDIIVATSAFGMGVDKSDVGTVIHYEISNSLENYIQEAGRAGRDEKITANCYVLFEEDDLNKHFILHNQTKLTIKEIQQVWKAVKDLTKFREKVSQSALEIARKAGWDDEVADMETRIKTAIAALEESGYLVRGNNSPRVFATGILTKTAQDAIDIIDKSLLFTEEDKLNARRIIRRLFSAKRGSEARDEEAENRVDYLADHLGIHKEKVIQVVNLLRQENILADSKDLTAFLKRSARAKDNAIEKTAKSVALENFLLTQLRDEPVTLHLKELNEVASKQIEDITPSNIKTILNIWAIQGWIKKERFGNDLNYYNLTPKLTIEELRNKLEIRRAFAGTIIRRLFEKAQQIANVNAEEVLVEFSVLELKGYLTQINQLFTKTITPKDIEDTLFYLSRIEAIKLEGGFMVLYNRLTIERKQENLSVKYKKEDYKKLEEHYLNRIQQIHIVGEYAERMVKNYKEALLFVDDYFQLNYFSFLNKYFPGNRKNDINLKITKKKFEQLYAGLSLEQRQIINDNVSPYIVVAAGPGSGKTKVLAHKLASLLQVEDVKHDQLLMLTFSRAAATEFKTRLLELAGNAANYVEIKTFHAYCFDLLGKVGDLEKSGKIIEETIKKIRDGEIVLNRITKAVLVIDEAQDISKEELALIKLLVEKNEEMRVILVGDDDQNIFEWRGASSDCMLWFLREKKATPYTLLDNYRSFEEILAFSNRFVTCIQNRIKTKPIFSKRGAGGRVQIVQYTSENIIVPLADKILQSGLTGSTCVLTRTNEEAALLAGLLRNRNYPVRLIQGNEEFALYNMLELRYFSNMLFNLKTDIPKIEKEYFEQAVQMLEQQFAKSTNLELVQNAINKFYQMHQERMYKSDWKSFLADSKLEDFYTIDSELINVATIHKAKGKEFDNIFLLLKNHYLNNEENKRLLYVAITRAKQQLSIHYNQSYFSGYREPGIIDCFADNNPYQAPDILSLILTHREVNLGSFSDHLVQEVITQLFPGTRISIDEDYSGCNYNGNAILEFSKRFKETLSEYLSKGYDLKSANIRHVVYWKTDQGKEIQIVLPEVVLEKNARS